MLYEYRRYFIKSGKMDECHQLMLEYVIPMLKSVKVTEVGYWTGRQENEEVYDYLLAYTDQAHYKNTWQSIANSKEWQAAKAQLGADVPWGRIESTLLNPTEYSALK